MPDFRIIPAFTSNAISTATFGFALEAINFVIDAPVSGGAKGAEDGTLSMMIGGDPGAVERVRPILECMGKTLKHIGPVGAGQVAKTCNQLVIAGTMMACAEMVALCRRMGRLKPGEVILVAAVSAAHRREALEACQHAVERLRAMRSVSKREVWEP